VSETFLPGQAPQGDQGLDNEIRPRSGSTSDDDVQKILDQISARQKAHAEKVAGLTAGDLAFALMRQIPREHWNTPLSKMGHWPRGSSIKEIKETPALLNYTPAQAILQLFEMDDRMKRERQ
jgi:hypothetical protein